MNRDRGRAGVGWRRRGGHMVHDGTEAGVDVDGGGWLGAGGHVVRDGAEAKGVVNVPCPVELSWFMSYRARRGVSCRCWGGVLYLVPHSVPLPQSHLLFPTPLVSLLLLPLLCSPFLLLVIALVVYRVLRHGNCCCCCS
jgi:hypothetical protein